MKYTFGLLVLMMGGCTFLYQPQPQDGVQPTDGRMTLVQGGTFTKGTTDSLPFFGYSRSHEVTLPSFHLDTTEVTQEDFRELMGYNPTVQKFAKPQNPVCDVSWFEAALYCNRRSRHFGFDTVYRYNAIDNSSGSITLMDLTVDRLAKGYRLPTDDEWEYACRAGSTAKYYWGDTFDSAYVWYRANSGDSVHTVASKSPNSWGLYDMCGNVWEWCDGHPGADSAEVWSEGMYDPFLFSVSSISRGGSFSDGLDAFVAACIDQAFSSARWDNFGFRCARNE